MAWVFQGVVNTCIQILLLIGFGWLIAWWKVLTSDKFLPQVNAFLLNVSIPCFNVYQLGIKLDLRDESAWRTLAAYVMWVSIIQIGIGLYIAIFGRKNIAEAGLQNLMLTANNTVMVGLPIMEATWGTPGKLISLLTAVVIFIQILPTSIALFEAKNWRAAAEAARAAVTQGGAPPDKGPDAAAAGAKPLRGSHGGGEAGVGTRAADGGAGAEAVPPMLAERSASSSCSNASSSISIHPRGLSASGCVVQLAEAGPNAPSSLHRRFVCSSADGYVSCVLQEGGQPAAGASAADQPPGHQFCPVCGCGPSSTGAGGEATHAWGPEQPHHQHLQQQPPRRSLSQEEPQLEAVPTGATLWYPYAALPHLPAPASLASPPSHRELCSISMPASSLQHHPATATATASAATATTTTAAAATTTTATTTAAAAAAAAAAPAAAPATGAQADPSTLPSTSTGGASTGAGTCAACGRPLPPLPPLRLGAASTASTATTATADQYQGQYQDQDQGKPAPEPPPPPPSVPESVPRLASMRGLSVLSPRRMWSRSARYSASFAVRDAQRGRGRGLRGILALLGVQLAAAQGSLARSLTRHSRGRPVLVAGGEERVQDEEGGWRAVRLALHRPVAHVRLWRLRMNAKIQALPSGARLALIILQNPMLWSLFLALIISCSGLRVYLDPDSPRYTLEVGWLVSVLRLITGTTVPLALFANGVWLYGKKFWRGNVRKVLLVLLIKVVLLPPLQLGCAMACRLPVAAAMALVTLSICPVASTSFVVASQYNHGADVVTMATVLGTLLLVPLTLAALNLPKVWGIYEYDVAAFPLP